MTHIEQAGQLAIESTVAVQVLMGAPDDIEFVPIKPRAADERLLADIKARWPGRGLRSVGVLGLVGTVPRCALTEPLEPEQVSALVGAFLAYLHALFCDSLAEQQEAGEIAELERLYALQAGE